MKLRRGKEKQSMQRQSGVSLGLPRDIDRHFLQKVAGQLEQGKSTAWLSLPQHLHINFSPVFSSQSTASSLCLHSAQDGRPSPAGWRGTLPAGRATWQLQQWELREVVTVAPRRSLQPGVPQSHNFVAPITFKKKNRYRIRKWQQNTPQVCIKSTTQYKF